MSWAWEKEGEGGGGAEKYHTLIFFIYVQLLCLSLLLSLMLQCRFNVKSKDQSCPSERYLLYQEWAHPKSFYKLQPLDLIRWRTVPKGLFMNMVQIWLTSGHGGHTVFVFAFTAESITERRSAFTSPGWVSTLWCWLWLLSWDWAASSTDIRPKKPALGGTWHLTRDFTLL